MQHIVYGEATSSLHNGEFKQDKHENTEKWSAFILVIEVSPTNIQCAELHPRAKQILSEYFAVDDWLKAVNESKVLAEGSPRYVYESLP